MVLKPLFLSHNRLVCDVCYAILALDKQQSRSITVSLQKALILPVSAPFEWIMANCPTDNSVFLTRLKMQTGGGETQLLSALFVMF